jgi:hypothetical protein
VPALSRGLLSRRVVAAASGIAAILALAGPVSAASAAPARPAANPGRTGPAITLARKVELSGYDAATDAAGTSFVGWIGSASDNPAGRVIYLCTLPRGATRCAGGIASTPSLGSSTAFGLRVLATPGGKVTLVWQYSTTASEFGPDGDEIATSTRQSDGSLSTATDQATAPSFGTMLDAALAPDGSIWIVSETGSETTLQLRPGFGHATVNLTTPWEVGSAQIAFGGGDAVLGIHKGGAITVPVSYAVNAGHGWSKFRAVSRTWSGAGFGLVHTNSGIRLIATVNNADYWPVVSRFSHGSFTRPQLTGDRHNCAPSTHDVVADSSGRMADVSIECDDLALANLTDTLHAAVVRINGGGTFSAGAPQLTTRPSGRGWVVWSIEDTAGNKLLVAPVLLAGRTRTVTASSGTNRAHLTGPASCLPPVTIKLHVSGSAARHWHVVSTALFLNGKPHGKSLNGGSLTAGKSYKLSGRVTFADGGTRRTVKARLTFRTCPNP